MSTVSKDGQDWLVLALDPFHDQQRPIEGLPDEYSAPTFVRCHVQQATYSATAEGDKFRIVFGGCHASGAIAVSTFNDIKYGNVASQTINAVQVYRSTSANEPTLAGVIAGTATSLGGFATSLPADIPLRLIAIGIEVTDVTQKLYQQGVIGVARVSGAHDEVIVPQQVPLTDNMGGFTTYKRTPCVPATRTMAGLIPGWVEWSAPKGAYVVPRFNKAQPPATWLIGTGESAVNPHAWEYRECAAADTIARYGTRANVATWEPSEASYRGAVPSGFDPAVIFIEGVDINAQFRVTVRTYVEYFPEVNNGTAMASATPSPAYDPLAFRSYHEAAVRLPAGVPVAMNAKGDWWRMVKSTFGAIGRAGLAVAPSVLTMAGQPELALALKAAQAIMRNPAVSPPRPEVPAVRKQAAVRKAIAKRSR